MVDATPIRPRSAATVAEWDYEADVVIAGYGIAGVSAAIEAARAGADVLVLERTSGRGGAAALAAASSTSAEGRRCRRRAGSTTPPRT